MKTSETLKTIMDDLVQVTEPNPMELAEAAKKAIGSTPLREFGAKTGISASTLSRIMNGKISKPLSAATILSIAIHSVVVPDDSAALLHELARANGMMSRAEQKLFHSHLSMQKARESMRVSVKGVMSTILLARLAERGASFNRELIESHFEVEEGYIKNATEMGIRYDFRLGLESDTQQLTWVFWTFPQAEDDYSDGSFNPRQLASQLMRELSPVFLADAWTPELYSEAKLSFCFVDESLFECFCHLLGAAKLNNRFSAILINQETLDIKEERKFSSGYYPDEISLFDLPIVVEIVKDAANAPEKPIGEDFLVFNEGEV